MKKNLRIISVAAAALLAVAPVATSIVPTVGANVVQAADSNETGLGSSTGTPTPSNSNAVTGSTPYFYMNGGEAIYNGGSFRTPFNASGFTKVSQIVSAINDNINFAPDGSNGNGRKEDITIAQVEKQLDALKIKYTAITDDKNGDATLDKSTLPANFDITLQHTVGNTAYRVTVPFYTTATPTPVTGAPAFYVQKGNGAAAETTSGQTYQVVAGSNFNPLSFTNSNGETVTFSARQSSNNGAAASISVASNPVDTTNAGRFYTVRLTATNNGGKTSSLSYTVLVVSNGLQKVYANGATSVPTYSIYGNQVSSNSTTFKDGQEVYVGNTTREINKVSYTKVSTTSKANADSSSNNLWIQTSALTQTTPSDSNTETHTVMIDSRAYDKNGNYLGHMYYAYDSIDIVPTVVNIKGKTYYKVANKDEYVRVTNITGNKRTLTHNAYIYWSSYRRTPGTGKMYKGQTVTTYGPAMRFKNGKKYYRIEGCRNNNKRYIKAANLSAAQ